MPSPDHDQPREIDPGRAPVDKGFRLVALGIAAVVLVIFGSIGVLLFQKSIPTFKHYGWSFFTESNWQPAADVVGVASAVTGTIEVALVALVIAFPLALGVALFISEYAPQRIKSVLVSLIDMMAAVPSIIFGLWGFFQLQTHAIFVSRWLDTYLGWIPIFHVNTNPNAAAWEQFKFTGSMFIAAIAVAMMVIPIACSVMRGVFDAAPIGEREAAYALGATRWGMVRTVVLPFGRGGIIGGTMLGLGRALGETVAVLLILQFLPEIKASVVSNGGLTISQLIANGFGDANKVQLSALLTAGLVLFVLTLIVNTFAATIVNRSRSGASTEI